MFNTILSKIFGTRNQRLIKAMNKVVESINALEPSVQQLNDQQLGAKTVEFRERYQQGESLDSLLPEAFAVVRETSVRTLGLRHFDVQLIGGLVLHSGKIAEMRTGEGKTLVATLAAYLNSLSGGGVHVVTVNDYLAKRDADWMTPIYESLGLTVGVNLPNMTLEEKKAAYEHDITYGTNNEFGFDYLRDNMIFHLENRVQRDHSFAIVDEVDSILIDEARTPLIISGPAEDSSELYLQINKLIPKLKKQEEKEGPGDFAVDEKDKTAFLTEEGHHTVETLFAKAGLLQEGSSLYDYKNLALMTHLSAALRAHALFQRDVDYIVLNKKVVIVDEHTGRLMEGRRWSEGLHQAVEAKEGVPIENENQTLATITFQNFFRIYDKLSGMTGTADTEAYEFQQIYGLEVVVIPTNKPVIRQDEGDQVYMTEGAKFKAIIQDIVKRCEKGQPILVGTASIDTSEKVSNQLQKQKIPHQVLNAKYHEKEAKIIAQAGRPGAVTIATNMAGRGTDIVLGGNLEAELSELDNSTEDEVTAHREEWQQRHQQVMGAGGLHVLGTERNESRRIDNQLRGRSGRQGDPGSSQYFLSLEDNLMRIFASDRVKGLMQRLGMQEDDVIEHGMVSKAIENAQRKVEGHNFDIRKHLLEFDDVANDQRKVIYQQRFELLKAKDIEDIIQKLQEDVVENVVNTHIPPQSFEEQWDVEGLLHHLRDYFHIEVPLEQWLAEEEHLDDEMIKQRVLEAMRKLYQRKEEQLGPLVMRQLEQSIMLQSLDQHWKEHLAAMDYLRQGIHLRGYAQKNPTQEFKRESFGLFTQMLDSIKQDVLANLCTIQLQSEEDKVQVLEDQQKILDVSDMQFQHQEVADIASLGNEMDPQAAELEQQEDRGVTFVREQPKVGRNDPCPCGSTKKYKHCHGRIQ